MKRVLFVLTCCLFLIAANDMDPIDSLVETLNHRPLWVNGAYPDLKLSVSAKPEEVIAQCFKMTGFNKGRVKKHHVLTIKNVNIGTVNPSKYNAALVETDLGKKIVLFRYEQDEWWSRVFDVN